MMAASPSQSIHDARQVIVDNEYKYEYIKYKSEYEPNKYNENLMKSKFVEKRLKLPIQ